MRLDAKEYESTEFSANTFNVDLAIVAVQKHLKEELSERHYKIYNMLFIQNMSEDDVAKELGYRSSEQGRKAGYKQIKNMRKFFKEKVIKIIKNKDIIL